MFVAGKSYEFLDESEHYVRTGTLFPPNNWFSQVRFIGFVTMAHRMHREY
jgi:hypothetical protein